MSAESLHPTHEELFAYRDGELGPEKRAVVEAHVVGCGACRALIDEVSGIESALRRAKAEPAADYYEKLPEAVLGRIGGADAEERATRGAPEGKATTGEPRIERRTIDVRRAEREGGRVEAAPRLPWAAVGSAAAAAAAVLVVAVILIRHGAVRRAVRPIPPPAVEKMEARAPEADAAAPEAAMKEVATAEPGVAGATVLLLRRFGLPALWNKASPGAGQTEPNLRYLYQTGHRRSSARVRLTWRRRPAFATFRAGQHASRSDHHTIAAPSGSDRIPPWRKSRAIA
jgi:hypothetical protein